MKPESPAMEAAEKAALEAISDGKNPWEVAHAVIEAYEAAKPVASKFRTGDRATKSKGSSWTGRVVGTYGTALTPEGYAVESETETGSVQIYPAAELSRLESLEAAWSKDDA